MRARLTWLLALSIASTATAFAAPPCDASEFRQFDFRIGAWVTAFDGLYRRRATN